MSGSHIYLVCHVSCVIYDFDKTLSMFVWRLCKTVHRANCQVTKDIDIKSWLQISTLTKHFFGELSKTEDIYPVF